MKSVDTYITIDPDGNVSFDFEGHISAEGVDMVSSPLGGDPFIDRSIVWHDVSIGLSGPLVSAIGAMNSETLATLLLYSRNPDIAAAKAWLDINSGTPSGTSSTSVTANAGPGNRRVIVDGARQSHFPQLPTLAKKMVSFGSFTVPWVGGSSSNTLANIQHGLGIAPTQILITHRDAEAAVPPMVPQWYGETTTVFTCRAYSLLGAWGGSSPSFSFMAIG